MIKQKNYRLEHAQKLIEKSKLTDEELKNFLNIRTVADSGDKLLTVKLDKYDKPDVLPEDSKHCYLCGQIKPKSEFYKRQTRCKSCHHVYYKFNPNSRKYHPTLK